MREEDLKISDEELKASLEWALESITTVKPKHPFTVTHEGMLEHVAKCPACDKQIRPNRDWTVEGRAAYLPVSFCPRCGISLDWRGVLGKDELGELEEVQ